MPRSRTLRLLLLPLLPAGLAVLGWLGSAALAEGLRAGGSEAWLMAWVLAFLVGLPVLIVALAITGALQSRRPWAHIVPQSGEKIPRTGQ
jgi:hypothetical protein